MKRHWWVAVGALSALALGAGIATAGVAEEHQVVGPRPNGTAVLPNGWSITPAGRQTPLGEMPFGSAVSPDGHTMLVSNDGQNVQSLQVVDVASGHVRQTIGYHAPEALFLGVAWSPDGRHAYASAGANDKIRVYDVAGQRLSERAPITFSKATGAAGDPIPAGLAVSSDGSKLFVANHHAASMSVVDLASKRVTASIPVGPSPYAVVLTRDSRTAMVSNWGGNTVTVVDTATNTVRRTVTVGIHPSAMAVSPSRPEVYVANSDSDDVSVLDSVTGAVVRRIDLAPYPHAPAGSSPDALIVSTDGATLYSANAGDNDVVVVRLASAPGQTDRVAGLIPTAWYPTGVHLVDGGHRLAVVSAKGLGVGPNPQGPNPYTDKWGDPTWERQYIYGMMRGQLSLLEVPDESRLNAYTDQVRRNNAFDANGPVPGPDQGVGSVIPRRRGAPSPIKHVIYVIKENRTYDQVLGDLPKGNGDPRLTLFGQQVTPNQHRLAEQFVTLDNFYSNGEVSSQGWQWVSGAASNTHVEKTAPGIYSFDGRNSAPSDGNVHVDDAGRNPTWSYIWDSLINAHLSVRDYGWFADGPAGSAQAQGNVPELNSYLDRNYPGWSLSATDRSRIQEWQREFTNYEATNTLPSFQMLQLPADHTLGTTAGAPTPKAMVADNDYALGQLVDTVSHSKDWKDTAIFVVEDDAQTGPDHVDAHRITAQVISPYTQTGKVDSTLYSQVSVLHAIEKILGLAPLSQFDAAANPMLNSFTAKPSFAPYKAMIPKQDMDERNGASAPMARQSSAWDFSKPDAAPPGGLNESIWKSVRGSGSKMPATRDHGQPVPAGQVASAPDGH
jgi:YVTN family beta-propeller protein